MNLKARPGCGDKGIPLPSGHCYACEPNYKKELGWPAIAYPWQLPPAGDWEVWLMLGGRGSGMTRATAEATHAAALELGGQFIGLHGPTLRYVRDVMVDGPSGLRSLSSPPHWEDGTKNVVVWPNGSRGIVLSCKREAHGHQFHFSWAESLHDWERLHSSWHSLSLATRLGIRPRMVATCVPRPLSFLYELADHPTTVVTRGSTFDNWKNLSPRARRHLESFIGTALERTMLRGKLP